MRDDLKKVAVFTKQPTVMNMTIASMQEAIEFWLKEKVFRDSIEIEGITFSEKDHFTIKLKRVL